MGSEIQYSFGTSLGWLIMLHSIILVSCEYIYSMPNTYGHSLTRFDLLRILHESHVPQFYKRGVVKSFRLSLRFLILALSIFGTSVSAVQPWSSSSVVAVVARRAGGNPSSTSSSKSSMLKYSRACSGGRDSLLFLQHILSRQHRKNLAHRFRPTLNRSSIRVIRINAPAEINTARPAAEVGRSGFMVVGLLLDEYNANTW